MRKTDRALADFSAALNSKQPYPPAAEPLCEIYFSKDKYTEVIPTLDRLIGKDPENALLVNRRAIAYLYSGAVEKAIADFDFVLSKASAEPSAYFYKALCYEKLGDLNAAVQNYTLSMNYGSPSTEQYAFAKRRIGELKR
jgi:tetratricopeptide (TPR) repeat protein